MFEIFKKVFTDVNFLSAFIQTAILIFLGAFFRIKNIITSQGKSAISAIVWKIAVPCFAFNAFMQDLDKNGFLSCLTEFFIAAFIYIILLLLGKISFIKKGKDISIIAGLFFAVGQTTLFSMPLLQSIYLGRDGEKEVMLYISMISIVFRIMVYLVGFLIISGEKIEAKHIGSSLKKVFFTPVMIGMFSGMFIYLFQDFVPQLRVDKSAPIFYQTVKTITKLVNPLSMFIIGMSVGEGNFRDAFKDKTAWLIAILRNIFAPIFVTTIALVLQKLGVVVFDEYSLTTLIIAFSAPVSVSLCVFCVQYHREELLASRTCMISSLLSLLTMPFAFVVCFIAILI